MELVASNLFDPKLVDCYSKNLWTGFQYPQLHQTYNMKKYILCTAVIIGVIVLFLLNKSAPESKTLSQETPPIKNIEGATEVKKPDLIVRQEPVLYKYSTDLLTKVPSPNAKIELYSTGETYEGAALLGTISFPETLIRNESASLIGTKKCGSDKDPELVVCQVGSFKGISIASYPEPYDSLAEKFYTHVCRFEKCSRDISVAGRGGKVFFRQIEQEGDAFYLFPSKSEGKTFAIKVGFNWADSEQTTLFDEQLRMILASIYQLE